MEWSSYCTYKSKSNYAFFKYHRSNYAAYKIYTENKSKTYIIKNFSIWWNLRKDKLYVICAIKVFLLFFFFSKFLSQIFPSHVYRVFGLTRILSPSTPIPPPSLSLASCCSSDQSILRPASPQSSSIPLFLEWITQLHLPLSQKALPITMWESCW